MNFRSYLFISFALIFYSVGYAGQIPVFVIQSLDSNSVELNRYWKIHEGDDSLWADPGFNDLEWDTLPYEKHPANPDSVHWYRIKIHVDSSLLNVPLSMQISQSGASEVYLDHIKLASFGKVSSIKSLEVAFDPTNTPLIFTFSNKNLHTLSVRYSNHITKKRSHQYGPAISISKANIGNEERLDSLIIILTFVDIAIGFFAGLTFLHLLLFFFYHADKNNLYYCLFNVLALLILASYHNRYYHTDSEAAYTIKYLLPLIYTLFFYAVFILSSRLFGLRRKWLHIVSLLLTVGTLAAYFMDQNLFNFLFISLIFNSCISTIFIIKHAYRSKREGVLILGSGLLFGVFFILIMAILIMANNFTLQLSGISAQVFFLFLVLSVISTPVSMSVYLARNFARQSKTLTKKLKEVEELSAITERQSREKEEFLSAQNVQLENLVSIRTAEVTEQKDKLAKQNELLENKSKEITESLQYASYLQQVILPPVSFIQKKVKECFIFYKPKDIVAGDFYFAEEVEHILFIAVADCTGHGVPGAMLSVLCSNALNQAVKEFSLKEPGKILDKTNDLVSMTFEKGNQQVNDGMDISFLAIDYQNKKLFWAGANNHLWYSEKGQILEIKANKQPIGKFDNKVPFLTHTVELNDGNMIYLFTDGYADQFGGKAGKKFMRSNLFNLLLSIHDKPASAQQHMLEDTFKEWSGNFDQVDDVTIIGIRI